LVQFQKEKRWGYWGKCSSAECLNQDYPIKEMKTW